MHVEGYVGICSCCFEPVKECDDIMIYPKGRHFHKQCIKKYPNSYYLQIETFRSRLENISDEEDLSKIMTDMEMVFNIPMINDEEFNRNNKEVMRIYRLASDARNL